MAKQTTFDIPLFSVTIILSLIGIIMVYSASAVIAMENAGNTQFYLLRQFVWLSIGLAGMIMVMKMDYRIFSRPIVVYGIISVSVILLVMTFFSRQINGTKRWIHFGSLTIQPAEFVKIALIIFVAYYLSRKSDKMDKMMVAYIPAFVIIGTILLLIVNQPDFGTAATLGLTVFILFFLGGMKWRHTLTILFLGLALATLLVMTAGYRMERITTFMNPESDPLGAGFQINQSLIAVGTGGLSGLGLAEGKQKLFFLPEPHTDFIFSVICEEFGFVGAILVIFFFIVLLWRGVKISLRSRDNFGAIMTAGLTLSIVFQAMINIGVAISILPTKGISLPFVSYGGSSLVCTLVAAGLILSVSQHAD